MEMKLSRKEIFACKRENAKITCVSGMCHITQEGDRQDYLLNPDDVFFSTRRKKIVVEALEHSSIMLEGYFEEKKERTRMENTAQTPFALQNKMPKMEYINKRYTVARTGKKEVPETING